MKNILLIPTILCNSLIANCQITTIGGSLIVITPTSDGIVIVADKKLTATSQGLANRNSSETTKIWKYNNYYGYAISGIMKTALTTNSVTNEFVVQDVVYKFLSRHEYPEVGKEFLDLLGKFINEEYSLFLLKYDPNSVASRSLKPFTFQVSICGYNPTIKKFQLGTVYCSTIENNSRATVTDISYYKKEDFLSSRGMLTGEALFARELVVGVDSKYDELRKKKAVTDFLINKDKKLYNCKYAISFSKWLIKETSKVYPKVGEEVDVAIIDKNGFRWIE